MLSFCYYYCCCCCCINVCVFVFVGLPYFSSSFPQGSESRRDKAKPGEAGGRMRTAACVGRALRQWWWSWRRSHCSDYSSATATVRALSTSTSRPMLDGQVDIGQPTPSSRPDLLREGEVTPNITRQGGWVEGEREREGEKICTLASSGGGTLRSLVGHIFKDIDRER